MKQTAANPVVRILMYAFAVLILVIPDLYTKYLADHFLKNRPSFVVFPGVLELRYLENTGAAFGILRNARFLFAVIAVSTVLLIFVLLCRIPSARKYYPLSFSLIFISAGALGNLIDRILLHYVRDFIYFSLIDFPVFNVADIYVTCATVLLIILILFVYKDEDLYFLKKKKAN